MAPSRPADRLLDKQLSLLSPSPFADGGESQCGEKKADHPGDREAPALPVSYSGNLR